MSTNTTLDFAAGGGAQRWLLPDGVQDVLPTQAQALEGLRRQLLDLYAGHGYDLIFPPLLEFREALLTGVGHDLAEDTFSIMDPLSGRALGLRADITPQVVRIDVSRNLRGVRRYCYAGTVVTARPEHLGGSRCSVQIGCELYGYAGIEADLEILKLLLLSLQRAGCRRIILELGHVGIFRGLVEAYALEPDLIARIFAILQRKARTELEEILEAESKHGALIRALLELSGDKLVVQDAYKVLASAPTHVLQTLAEIDRVIQYVSYAFPEVELYVDLAELRGYHYHTGLIFVAYADERRFEVAKGGRYDAVGAAFGRACPATGFSMDVLKLCSTAVTAKPRIWAPANPDPGLLQCILRLQQDGYTVVQCLPNEQPVLRSVNDQELVHSAGDWFVQPSAADSSR